RSRMSAIRIREPASGSPHAADETAPGDAASAARAGRGSTEQVGPSRAGALELLLPAPGRDGAVIAAEEDRGHGAVTPHRRLRVRGVLEQPVLVGFLHEALRVADD